MNRAAEEGKTKGTTEGHINEDGEGKRRWEKRGRTASLQPAETETDTETVNWTIQRLNRLMTDNSMIGKAVDSVSIQF